MPEPSSGTVTFLFTDIEGSTARWEQATGAMRVALTRHDALIRAVVGDHGGRVVKTTGDGFLVVFGDAGDALNAAIEAQRRMQAESWGEIGELRVRMALHTGAAEERDGDFFGPPLNRAARLMSLGHGGQILLSEATSSLVRERLPSGSRLIDLGEHRLKDLMQPERVSQVTVSDLRSDFPPLVSLNAHHHNLPVHPTELLGREREVGEVLDLLRGTSRLVTLTGPGGTGKTRLSLQVAAEVVGGFRDGVFLVELAPIVDPALVIPTIAQVLGVREMAGSSSAEALREYLRSRSVLLVLDNFEQVVAAASALGDLLAASPGLKILVTSREPLRLRGEREYAVSPLGLPEAHEAAGPEVLMQYGALALFLDRAVAIRADFAVTPENAASIREICVRLDGLPLAIELAAARVRLLTPEAMARRLERRLPLLTGGARDLPTRQQTLRGAIDWSHDLLDESERRLFRRLSVFVGGWSFEAAAAVCGGGDLDMDVLDGLESLVAKSLVKQGADFSAEPRFSMLETIREYATEQLDASGEAAATRDRHARHFLDLAERAAPRLNGPEQLAWLDRLTTEHDNARAAITWMQGEGGDLDGTLRLVIALYKFWRMRNHWGDFERIDAAIEASRGQVSLARATALRLASDGHRQGDDRARPVRLGEEAVAMFRALGDRAGLAQTLVHLGILLRDRRDLARAWAVTEEGLAIARALGDRETTGIAQYHLASILWYEQFADQPIERLLTPPGRGTAPEVGTTASETDARLAEDVAASAARARALLEEAIATSRDLGNVWHTGMMLVGGGALGQWAWATGEYAAATEAFSEGIRLYVQAGDTRSVGDALANLARVALSLGNADRAARLFGAADAMYEASGTTRMRWNWPTSEEERAAVQSRLSADDFEAGRATGRAMTMEQAVAYALEGDGSS
jgi:predicted ATPase/class 3 adenylate cyclase